MSEVKWCIKHQLPHCPSLHCISVYGSMFSVPHRQMYGGMEGRKTKKERDRQTDRHKQINRTKSIRRHVAHWTAVALEIVSYLGRHFHLYWIYCRQIQELSCQSFLLLLHWHIGVKGMYLNFRRCNRMNPHPLPPHPQFLPSNGALNKTANISGWRE